LRAIGCRRAWRFAFLSLSTACRSNDRVERAVYRIGVNLGDVLIEGDDILDEGVNIAARPSRQTGSRRGGASFVSLHFAGYEHPHFRCTAGE
jgi:hypothetical protein